MSSRFRADGAIVPTPVNCSDCPSKRLRTHPSRRRAFTSFASSIQPGHPQPIQPALGGISRRSFWTPADAAFELALIATLVVTWSQPEIRIWLLIGLANHATMRIWSAFDFIPKALAFERADPATIAESTARIGRAAVSGACAAGRGPPCGNACRFCGGGAAYVGRLNNPYMMNTPKNSSGSDDCCQTTKSRQ